MRDKRLRAIAITLAAIVAGGGVLAWMGGLTSRPTVQAVEPHPRT